MAGARHVVSTLWLGVSTSASMNPFPNLCYCLKMFQPCPGQVLTPEANYDVTALSPEGASVLTYSNEVMAQLKKKREARCHVSGCLQACFLTQTNLWLRFGVLWRPMRRSMG